MLVLLFIIIISFGLTRMLTTSMVYALLCIHNIASLLLLLYLTYPLLSRFIIFNMWSWIYLFEVSYLWIAYYQHVEC